MAYIVYMVHMIYMVYIVYIVYIVHIVHIAHIEYINYIYYLSVRMRAGQYVSANLRTYATRALKQAVPAAQQLSCQCLFKDICDTSS